MSRYWNSYSFGEEWCKTAPAEQVSEIFEARDTRPLPESVLTIVSNAVGACPHCGHPATDSMIRNGFISGVTDTVEKRRSHLKVVQ